MPEWAEQVLQQSPTLAVFCLVVWYACGVLTKSHDKHLHSMESHIKNKSSEIKQLRDREK